MAILMPDLTVQVYNADYRVLSRVPWQEAVPQPGGMHASTATVSRVTGHRRKRG